MAIIIIIAMKNLRLTLDLVPSSAWNQNLRKLLPKNAWGKIRAEVLKKSEQKCMICGQKGKLDCHEVWDYDDTNRIQKLAGFLALCRLCHAVKHLGYSDLKGNFSHDRLVKHFMKVNGCSHQDFLNHQKVAYAKFEERSHFEWGLDLK